MDARRRRLLRRAAEVMEQRGYVRGSQGMPTNWENPMSPKGPVCLLGAVEVALFEEGKAGVNSYVSAAEIVQPGTGGGGYSDFYRFSDSLVKRMTKEEAAARVASVLRRLSKGLNWNEATSK